MRVLVAGASGVIGDPLVRRLAEAGHEVVGTTRSDARAAAVRAAGAEPIVVDVFDRDALVRAVGAAKPEVVVNELTSLPRDYDPRKMDDSFYGPTNRVRSEGGGNLLEAARSAGARRFVTQSIAFLYAPEGPMVKDESARPWTDAPGPFGNAVRTMVGHEGAALEAAGLESLVLRYGWLYGPGTYYARDGAIADQVRKRRFPVIGGSDGLFSYLHVDDAAGATVAACEGGAQGIYNVVDDDPAAIPDWLPAYAAALGAKRPLRVPGWLGRLLGGTAAKMTVGLRGASNAKVKHELGWEPRHPSWREGFVAALG
ncbi:MAG: NAD-dependent epimerase/dehydratase family protein [Solirubrobacterales bacterium]